ncbi:hypothetical protein DFH07DRAFT_777885 [Mycena maculata]|uniref:Uncharacterized protein n=1 Tax=Mycena maculata TaxID=230809 RepID=A0AAD7N1T9_9AGAR|nr:hypothetical protein DFH07DRAFT_777885 [Mycena maculata]
MFRLLLPSPGENEESNSDSDFGSGNDLGEPDDQYQQPSEPSTTFTFHCLSLLLLPASSPLGPKRKEPSPDLIATTSSQRPTKRYKPATTEEELDALEPEACKKLRKLIKRCEHRFTVRKVVRDFATSPLEQQKVITHVQMGLQDYNIQGAAALLPRVPAPLVNEDCYVFALLGGHPNDPGWKSEVADPAAAAMEAAAEKMYGQVFYGVYLGKSMGGGQVRPMTVFQSVLHQLGTHYLNMGNHFLLLKSKAVLTPLDEFPELLAGFRFKGIKLLLSSGSEPGCGSPQPALGGRNSSGFMAAKIYTTSDPIRGTQRQAY